MLAVNGLYGHIQRNNAKSVLLLTGFAGLLWVFWYAWCLVHTALFARPKGLPRNADFEQYLDAILWRAGETAIELWFMPVFGACMWFGIAYAFQAAMIRLATGAQPVQRSENPRLYNLVENLAITAGLAMPALEIMETPALNAYAAGLSPGDAVVAVTRGLLDTLDDDELEAVLAHEMTHIKNRDVRLMVVAGVFAGGLTMAGDVLRACFSRGGGDAGDSAGGVFDLFQLIRHVPTGGGKDGGKNAGLFAAVMVALVLATGLMLLVRLFALLTQFSISRSREFLADAGAVELTKNPDAMISALLKISGNDAVPVANDTVMAMMISADTSDLFATHPTIEDRVAALKAHAGGRVRPPRSRRKAQRSADAVRTTFGLRQGRPAAHQQG